MNNKYWFTDIFFNIISFFKDILTRHEQEIEEIEYIPPTPEPVPVKTSREILYETAKACLGMDASPKDAAPDDLACADSVNQIHFKAFGFPIEIPGISTAMMYQSMLKNKELFQVVTKPLHGDIIISPTGYGNGRLTHGHMGIVGKYGIMSNDSMTGKWRQNYTLESWISYFQWKGGFPVVFFRRIN